MFNNFKFPESSILGFRILNAMLSIVFAYLFIILHFLGIGFGSVTKLELISKSIFILICDLSFILLSLNIYFKRNQLKKSLKVIFNLPIILFLPYSIFCIILNSIFIIHILFWIKLNFLKLISKNNLFEVLNSFKPNNKCW